MESRLRILTPGTHLRRYATAAPFRAQRRTGAEGRQGHLPLSDQPQAWRPPDEKPGGKQGARVETGRAEAGQREESGRSAAGAFGAIAAAYRTGRNPVGGATAPGCWGCVPKREAARKFPVTAQPGRGRPRMALALALLPTRSDVPLALWPCAQPDQPDAKATTATGAPRALV